MKNTVSLLPSEYIHQRKREASLLRMRSVMSTVVFALVAVLVAFAALLFTKAASLNNLKSQNVQVQQQIQEMGVFQQLATDTALLRDKVEKVEVTDPAWLRQMSNVASVLPRSVSLEQFDGNIVERDTNGLPLVISADLLCSATNFEDVALTIRALEESTASKAVCTASDTIADGGVRFSLTVTLPLEV